MEQDSPVATSTSSTTEEKESTPKPNPPQKGAEPKPVASPPSQSTTPDGLPPKDNSPSNAEATDAPDAHSPGRKNVSDGSEAFDRMIRAIKMLNEFENLILDIIKGQSDTEGHSNRITGDSEGIYVMLKGTVIRVINRAHFERKLKTEDFSRIKTFEQSLQLHYEEWDQLDKLPDELKNAETKKKLSQSVVLMAQYIFRITKSLEKAGYHLDDHYKRMRDAVEGYRPD